MNHSSLVPILAASLLRAIRLTKWQAVLISTILVAPAANAADLTWIGGTGVWNAAPNWNPAQIPTAADNVFITNSGTYTVIVDRVDPTVASLTIGGTTGTQTLSLDRTIFTLNGASTIKTRGRLEMLNNGTTLAGSGNLTVDGGLIWTGGNMIGAGVTRINAAATATINGNAELDGRTFVNAGVATWSAGSFDMGNGAVFSNLVGATFNVTFDGNNGTLGGAATTIVNAGLFRKTAGAARTDIAAQFNNIGTVESQAATLRLAGGGTHPGTIITGAGATVEFGGGTHVLPAGSLVTGNGVVNVIGATTLTASGTFDTAGSILSITAGTANLTASCNVTGSTLNVSGGTLNFSSAGTVSTVNLTAGTLGGTSPVTVTGLLTLGGGTITNALVTASGGLNINGGVTLNGGKLINPANAVWSAGNLTGANGAVFSNLLGATFVTTFDGNAAAGAGATPTFVNAGSFQKIGGTAPLGNTSIDFQFINTGSVEVRTNTLRYAFNQQTSGLTLLNGGNLTAQAQPLQILGGTLMGTGLVSVANVQNFINASAVSPGLPLGHLDVSGNYQQTSAGVLNIDLGGYAPGTNYDQIRITGGGAGGVATLGGTLNITLTNGFYPTNGATFTFVTAQSRVGAFSTINYPTNEIGIEVNYDLTSAKITVINLKPIAVQAINNPPAGQYGSTFNFQFAANTFADPDNDPLTYTAAGLPPGINFAPGTRTFSGTPTQAGTFPVTVFATDGGTPSLTATSTFTITIAPADLTIVAQPQNKVYGEVDPALTYTVTGLLFSNTPASVLSGSLARSLGETVANSPYAITQGTLVAGSNYTINFIGSSLHIARAPLSVTAEALSKTFGTTDPTFTATYVGFVNGETPGVLGGTLAFTRTPGEGVGTYAITPSGLTSGDYDIAFNSGTLTITAPIPQVLSVAIVGSNNIEITWSAVSNATYRVQFNSGLIATNWTDLAGDIASSGNMANKVDVTASASINRFYRVQVVP